MSFFEDDDEPIRASRTRPAVPRRPPPPRRPGGPGGGGSSSGGGASIDDATLRQRRLVAGGGALVGFLLLVFLVNGCLDSRKQGALKDYNRAVAEVIADSERVSEDFFAAMNAGGAGGDLVVRVNQLRLTADELVKRTKGLDVPGEMARAQNDLELVLNFRAQGLRRIGGKLPSAQVSGRDNAQTAEEAVAQIAGQMQVFLASDVVYSQRVQPYIKAALDDADVDVGRIRASQFLPNLGWLDADQVAGRLGSERAAGGTGADPNPAPGLHGHGLTSVTAGDVALQPGNAVNRVPASPVPAFAVKFANQGDNDEREVSVSIRVAGSGKPLTRRKTVSQTKAKTDASVSIPLGATPPRGEAVTITVTVAKVPGEMNTENNKQTFTVLFTG